MGKPILFETISRAKFDALPEDKKVKKNYSIREADGTYKKYIGNLIGADSGTVGTPNEKAKAITSWADLQAKVRSGEAKEIFSIGDYFLCDYGTEGRQLGWMVIGFDQNNGDSEHSMSLIALEPICPMDFSPVEHLYVHHEESDLGAGTYHFNYNNSNFQFTITKAIPVGGYFDKNSNTINTYDAEGTQLESITATTGTQGTELTVNTYISYESSYRRSWGNGRYKVSQVRAFLTGDESDLNPFIVPSERYKSETKFTEAIDPEFLAVVSPTAKKIARDAEADGEGFDEISDKFYLLSHSEVFCAENEGEGEAYQYFKEKSTHNEPGTSDDPCRALHWTRWWLCSPSGGPHTIIIETLGYSMECRANNSHCYIRPAATIR